MKNELRIGNWVKLNNSKYNTTIKPSSFSIDMDALYSPIKLTKHWIKQFKGFEVNVICNYEKKLYNDIKLELSIRDGVIYPIIVQENDFSESSDVITLMPLSNVHDLQNLHYELCGEELEIIKPNKI